MPLICDIFWQHKRRYGARRIAVELAAQGRTVRRRSRGKTAENPGFAGHSAPVLQAKTTDSRHALGYSPNLLLRSAPPAEPQPGLGRRHHYIPLKETAFAYLALMLDLCLAPRRRLEPGRADDRDARPRRLAARHPQRASRRPA